jgi:hypothetical protein
LGKRRSDCGAIATMAEYVDRPLQRKAEELEADYAKATK